MAKRLDGKQNVKILVLYLLENAHTPLSYLSLCELVQESDFILYFDFAEGFPELLRDRLISPLPEDADKGDGARYTVTQRGRLVAEQLSPAIPAEIREESLRTVLRHLHFKEQGISPVCHITQTPDGKFLFLCRLEQNGQTIFETRAAVDSLARARQMQDNFLSHPENVWRGMWSLLCGDMQYLFNQ